MRTTLLRGATCVVAGLFAILAPEARAQVSPTPAIRADDGSASRLFPLADGNYWRFQNGISAREIKVVGAAAPYFLVEGIAARPVWMYQSTRYPHRANIYVWNETTSTWSVLIDLAKGFQDQAGSADLTGAPCDTVATEVERRGFDELTRIGTLGKVREYGVAWSAMPGETCTDVIELSGLDLAAGTGPVRMRLRDGRVLDLAEARVGGRRYSAASVGTDPRAIANARLRTALERASVGLLNPSESDFPFEVAIIKDGGAGRRLTALEVAARMGHDRAAPVEEIPLDGFFSRLVVDTSASGGAIDAGTARRYRELRALLTRELTDVRVIRVGDLTHAPVMFGLIDVYILGRTRSGDLVGLRTRTVET